MIIPPEPLFSAHFGVYPQAEKASAEECHKPGHSDDNWSIIWYAHDAEGHFSTLKTRDSTCACVECLGRSWKASVNESWGPLVYKIDFQNRAQNPPRAWAQSYFKTHMHNQLFRPCCEPSSLRIHVAGGVSTASTALHDIYLRRAALPIWHSECCETSIRGTEITLHHPPSSILARGRLRCTRNIAVRRPLGCFGL